MNLDLGVFRAFAALTLAALFAFSALAKLRARADFHGAVTAYGLLPRIVAPLLADLIIAAEICAAILLLLSLYWNALAMIAGGLSATLLGVFSMAIAINLLRGRSYIDCGCYPGAAREMIGWRHLLRNALLLLLSALSLWPLPVGPWALIQAAFAAVAAAALYLSLEQLRRNQRMERLL